jgi:hypothetical protein
MDKILISDVEDVKILYEYLFKLEKLFIIEPSVHIRSIMEKNQISKIVDDVSIFLQVFSNILCNRHIDRQNSFVTDPLRISEFYNEVNSSIIYLENIINNWPYKKTNKKFITYHLKIQFITVLSYFNWLKTLKKIR